MTARSPKSPKTFTLAEANALLPKVRALVEQLQQLQRSIVQANAQSEQISLKISTGNGYPIHALKDELKQISKHQLKLIEAFQSVVKQLETFGCELKDLSTGLIDFYSYREDELIFLCWKLGEDRIEFWHTLNDGFAGRQRLTAT